MNGDTNLQIENGKFMRILNKIVDVLAHTKLSGREFRVILCILRYTYGFNRKEWEFTPKFISDKSRIDVTNINKVVSRLQYKKIIYVKRTGNSYIIGFNKYYKEWQAVSQIRLIDTTPKISRKRLKSQSKKTKSLVKKDYKTRSKAKTNKRSRKPKYNTKDNIKTPGVDAKESRAEKINKSVALIKTRWNELAMIQKKKKKIGFISIRNVDKPNKNLDSIIEQRLYEHTESVVLQAIGNYHKFMMLPKEHKRWQGHSWNLQTFLKRGKDYVAQYSDWDTIVFNYCNTDKVKTVEKDMTLEKAMGILEYNQTTATMEDIIRRMPDEEFIELKLWLKQKKDMTLLRLYNDATKIIRKEKEVFNES
jgi:phage replication O-like protein O